MSKERSFCLIGQLEIQLDIMYSIVQLINILLSYDDNVCIIQLDLDIYQSDVQCLIINFESGTGWTVI
jgi:hypothetical protein